MIYGTKPEKSRRNYRLLKKAEIDLLDIAIHGDREFGIASPGLAYGNGRVFGIRHKKRTISLD